jgi:hypothetical protein
MYENYAKVIDLGLQRVCHCIFLTLGSSSSSSSYTLSTFLLLLFPVYRHCYHSSSSIPFFISLWPYESSLLCSSCDWGCYAVAVVALVSCTGTELDRRMLHFELNICTYCWNTLYSLGDTLKPTVFFCFSSLVTLLDIELDR